MEYYVQLFSPHGLIRYRQPEIGRDRDTGGQVKYVLDLLENLSFHPAIRKVDLFTRKIMDETLSEDYAQELERVNDKARIIRMACGDPGYREKETLWPFLDEFISHCRAFTEKEEDRPDVVHGHYADGNYVACQLSVVYNCLFLATGHSLGINKRHILKEEGWKEEEIIAKFSMDKRIEAEELMLRYADRIIVSTSFEMTSQYSPYQHYDQAKFEVIPPGINHDVFYPFYRQDMPSFTMEQEQERALYHSRSEIERFLFRPDMPLILSVGRPDKRKNFETIISTYGQDKELQSMADLAIFAGVRNDITQMPVDEQETLTNLLLLLDKYDLYGKMAIPKKNDPVREIPEIYRLAARRKGVFINATPGENFGLTIIEAAACGLPVIASHQGGPKDIINQMQNGILVDMADQDALAAALKMIISDGVLWEKYSTHGVSACGRHYSWASHVEKYIEMISALRPAPVSLSGPLSGNDYELIREKISRSLLLFLSDLDGTLVGEEKRTPGIEQLTDWISSDREKITFGIVTGRNKSSLQEAFRNYVLPPADIMICAVGTEIYYTDRWIKDSDWDSYIGEGWDKDLIAGELMDYPGLKEQPSYAQTKYKLSYYVEDTRDEGYLIRIMDFMKQAGLTVNIYLSENRYLDIVPHRAGKGNAVSYISRKYEVPPGRIITAGNSGNDVEMLSADYRGIVVSNHTQEVEFLKGCPSVYFSREPLSSGVWEGLNHHYIKGKGV